MMPLPTCALMSARCAGSRPEWLRIPIGKGHAERSIPLHLQAADTLQFDRVGAPVAATTMPPKTKSEFTRYQGHHSVAALAPGGRWPRCLKAIGMWTMQNPLQPR